MRAQHGTAERCIYVNLPPSSASERKLMTAQTVLELREEEIKLLKCRLFDVGPVLFCFEA